MYVSTYIYVHIYTRVYMYMHIHNIMRTDTHIPTYTSYTQHGDMIQTDENGNTTVDVVIEPRCTHTDTLELEGSSFHATHTEITMPLGVFRPAPYVCMC